MEVLENLKTNGISIRVASPKLVMEEVMCSSHPSPLPQQRISVMCDRFSCFVGIEMCFAIKVAYIPLKMKGVGVTGPRLGDMTNI